MKNYKYSFVCSVCGKNQKTCVYNKKVCSNECKKIYYNKKSGRTSDDNLSPSTIGTVAELVISIDLMKKGYQVFRGLSPSCYCDLIAIKTDEKKKLEVEVRTGHLAHNKKLNYPKGLSKYDNGNIDLFGIVDRKSGQIFYRDREDKEIIIT